MPPVITSDLLAALAARLARAPIAYAGGYGSQYGGWARWDSDLDLVVAYPRIKGHEMDWTDTADALKADLRKIAARWHVELDFSIGVGLFDHVHPAQVATFLVGPALAGTPAAVADTATIALATQAQDQTRRAALAAAKRAALVFDPGLISANAALGAYVLRGVVDDLAASAGYLRCGGKDRREPEDLRRDLLAGLPSADQVLLRRLYAGDLPAAATPAAVTVLERLATGLRQAIETRLA